MLTLLLPVASRWKELGGKFGCGEDHLDEVFTNNETDRDCLHNLCDVYNLRLTTTSLAATLKEMGETELAEKCGAGKQGDCLIGCVIVVCEVHV